MFTPAHLRAPGRDRALLAGSLIALVVVAWISLWFWGDSRYAAYLDHSALGGPTVLSSALFTVGWLLMIVAMMLPSSVPLVVTFSALVRHRARPRLLVALLLAGYLAIWTGFGLVAWTADLAVHAAVDSIPQLAEHPQLIIAATLMTAGLWQFSPLRDRCLDACRSPLGFVLSRWKGRSERREALFMGVAHGAFCIGCCWSLMLVMFGVGVGSFVAMVGLGAVTAIEKNLPQGRRLTHPVGVGLILAAVYAIAA